MSGVVEATEGAFAKHPALWGGALLGVVAIIYLYSRSGSSSSASPTFTYSSGPSDAAVAAGAAVQVAQIQANQAAATTAANTSSATAIAQSYFSYLSNAAQIDGSNQSAQIAATQNTALGLAGINAGVTEYGDTTNAGVTEYGDNTSYNIAQTQASQAIQTANIASNQAIQTAGIGAAAYDYGVATQASIDNTNAYYNYAGTVNTNATNAQIANYNYQGLVDSNATALSQTEQQTQGSIDIASINQGTTLAADAIQQQVTNYQTYEEGVPRG